MSDRARNSNARRSVSSHRGNSGYRGKGGQNRKPRKDVPRDQPIPSPYNFVTLNKHVWFPDDTWVHETSQDMPLKGGICGWLELEIKAETPVYIRCGGVHPEKAEDRRKDATYPEPFEVIQPDGTRTYALPGSSIKGMMRNVVEIASFSKLGNLDNHRYSFRDLTPGSDYPKLARGAKAGWLKRNGNSHPEIRACSLYRIEQREIESLYRSQPGKDNESLYLNDPGSSDKAKSAVEKYHKWGNITLSHRFRIKKGVKEPVIDRRTGKVRISLNHDMAFPDTNGPTHGVLVFTGQPSRSKKKEFVFGDKTQGEAKSVSSSLWKDFQFIHSDENRQPNREWKFWKARYKSGERVPVFFHTNEKGEVESLGLAMMYRLPYMHRVHDGLPEAHRKNQDDFTELLFGYAKDKQNGRPAKALRGRIQVETALAIKDPKPLRTVHTVLNGPKPTYVPNYIEQPTRKDGQLDGRKYSDYNTPGFRIRGHKRYYTRAQPDAHQATPEQKNVSTQFKPLPVGTCFRTRLHVHNVRPEELGALIWALRFGENPFEAGVPHHQIGMAKPYGYGRISMRAIKQVLCLRTNDGSNLTDESILNCMKAFCSRMEKEIPDWGVSNPRIRALREMADPEGYRPDKQEIRYPELDHEEYGNEFRGHKKNSKVLQRPFDSGREPQRQLHATQSKSPSPRPPRPTGHKPKSQGSAAFQKRQQVTIVALEETTKNGRRKYQIEGAPETKGLIDLNSKQPKDESPGTMYPVIILANAENNFSYRLL